MARFARVAIPGLPHHITQRGNRRQQTFVNDGDYAAYLELTAESCNDQGVQLWSDCLMPNHAHAIAVPSSENGLRWAIGETHRRSTRRLNFREKWRGYLWQGRFASLVMDEPYLLAAARYIELNPVRAGLVSRPCDWPWSSAPAHLAGRDDQLVKVAPLLDMIPDWTAFLNSAIPEEDLRDIRRHTRTGRPLGDEAFLGQSEDMIGRVLKPQKRGPKQKRETN